MATTNIELDIENITGVADADDQFIKTAQKFVVASIPKDLMLWAGTSTSTGSHGGDSSPTAITLPQPTDSIIDVQRNGMSAIEVAESMQGFIANTSSLHLATSIYPKYYIQAGNKIIVKPDPSDSETALVNYVDFLKVDDDCDLKGAVVFYASANEFSKLSSAELPTVSIAAVPPDVPSLATVSFTETNALNISTTTPTAISLSTVSYSDASNADASATSVASVTVATVTEADSSSSAPAYTKPGHPAQVAFSSYTSGLSESDPGVLSIAATVPSVPTISAQVIVDPSGSAPTYTKPVRTSQIAFNDYWTLGDFPDSDPGLLTISVSAPTSTVSPIISSPGVVTTVIADITTNLPTYTPPVINTPDFSDANDWINTEEDSEMLTSRMQVINGQISEFSTKLQDSLNEFNEDNAKYQASIQAEIQLKQHLAAENQKEADLTLQASIQDYTLELQRFQADVSKYQAQVNDEVQEYSQKLARYQLELNTVFQAWSKTESDNVVVYQADLQNELNEFNKENVKYQAILQEYVQESQLLDAHESRKIQKYQSEVQTYQADVNKQVQEYTQKLSQYQLELNTSYTAWAKTESDNIAVFQADIQNELNEFNKENSRYQGNLQTLLAKHNSDLQKVLAQAQLDAADAQQEARQATEIDQFNKAQDQVLNLTNAAKQIEDVIADNQRKVVQYQSEASHYATEVNQYIQNYTSRLQKDTQDTQATIANNDDLIAKYQSELQQYASEVQAETSEYQNKLQKQQAYSKEADKYYQWANTEVSTYIQNNSKMIAATIASRAQTAQA